MKGKAFCQMDGIFCINYLFWEFVYVKRRTSLSSGGANERGRRELCGWEGEWVMGGVFFFQKMCIFFPGKVYNPLTHSFSGVGKKKTTTEKKHISTQSHDFSQKVSISKLFLRKKIPYLWLNMISCTNDLKYFHF